MADVPRTVPGTSNEDMAVHSSDDEDDLSDFERSRWFTRGWTLQELIAPNRMVFFDCAWNLLGERHGSLQQAIYHITGVDKALLRESVSDKRNELTAISVARRMSWAARRVTTRKEDEAYCLLGIFGVNMPLLYGEEERAFRRLQEEIIRGSTDQFIFAWGGSINIRVDLPVYDDTYASNLLATSPKAFGASADVSQRNGTSGAAPYAITNAGVRITLIMIYSRIGPWYAHTLAVLGCKRADGMLALSLSGSGGVLAASRNARLVEVAEGEAAMASKQTFLIPFHSNDQVYETPWRIDIWLQWPDTLNYVDAVPRQVEGQGRETGRHVWMGRLTFLKTDDFEVSAGVYFRDGATGQAVAVDLDFGNSSVVVRHRLDLFARLTVGDKVGTRQQLLTRYERKHGIGEWKSWIATIAYLDAFRKLSLTLAREEILDKREHVLTLRIEQRQKSFVNRLKACLRRSD